MSSALYHREVGLPLSVRTVTGIHYLLRYTKHAFRACLDDRYGIIQPPPELRLQEADIVEVETFEGRPVKVVVRIPYNSTFDLILALMPDTLERICTVKTCWLNRKTDAHKTLDRSRYVVPR